MTVFLWGSDGILWNSLRDQAKYHEKKANVGTNPTPSASFILRMPALLAWVAMMTIRLFH